MPDVAPPAPPISPEELERLRERAVAGNGHAMTPEAAEKIVLEDRERRIAAFQADVKAASEKHRVRLAIATRPYIDTDGRIRVESELQSVPL